MIAALYDPRVATALFEPIRARLTVLDDAQLATMADEFLAWSVLEPAAAADRLEKVPVHFEAGLGMNGPAWRGLLPVAGDRLKWLLKHEQSGRRRREYRNFLR